MLSSGYSCNDEQEKVEMVAEDAQPQNKFAKSQMQCSKPCIVRRAACILHFELLSMESKMKTYQQSGTQTHFPWVALAQNQ